MLWTFVFAFVVYCPHFFYSMVYIISLQSKFSPGPKKNTRTERKLPRSRPDPFSWARTGPIPVLSKIWPRDPSRVGVARSGPGIPRRSGVPRSSLLRSMERVEWSALLKGTKRQLSSSDSCGFWTLNPTRHSPMLQPLDHTPLCESDYLIRLFTPAIGPNKSQELAWLKVLSHTSHGKVGWTLTCKPIIVKREISTKSFLNLVISKDKHENQHITCAVQ